MKRSPIIILAAIVLCIILAGWWFFRWQAPRREHAKRAAESRKAWVTPISFYGKVVDEKGSPVADANVKFVVSDLSAEGTTEHAAKSDAKGLFTFMGKGKGVSVYVSKDGYYTSQTDRIAFEYAAGGGQHG